MGCLRGCVYLLSVGGALGWFVWRRTLGVRVELVFLEKFSKLLLEFCLFEIFCVLGMFLKLFMEFVFGIDCLERENGV